MFVPPDDVVGVMDGTVIKSGVTGARVLLALQQQIRLGEQVDLPPLVGRRIARAMSNADLGINWDGLADARTILHIDEKGEVTCPEGAVIFLKDQPHDSTGE